MKLLPSALTALALSLATTQPVFSDDAPAPPVQERPLFAPTPLLDIDGQNDFPAASALDDAAAAQLQGLCSLQEFRTLPTAERHVYSFDPWPVGSDALGEKSYNFNLKLTPDGGSTNQIAFASVGGGPAGSHDLIRVKGNDGRFTLQGLGNLSWSGNMQHKFVFDKPVRAFGVVLKSSADMELRKFYWPAAVERNGYPLSYTLSDGSVVNLGARDVRGALLKGDTSNFLGVIDRSGLGIVSLTYTMKGLAGNKAQSIALENLAFVSFARPSPTDVISLRSAHDFPASDVIAPIPTQAATGLAPLDDFRFIVGNHRFVYHSDASILPAINTKNNSRELTFDLKGKGTADQKVTLISTASAKDAWTQHSLKFSQPVWSCGVTLRPTDEIGLGEYSGVSSGVPVSYTLSDGTVVDVGEKGKSGGTLAANAKTFVGVVDKSDKGIKTFTFRLQGRAKNFEAARLEDIAFALAGPPPGNWKLTLADEFNGDRLNPDIWTPGYTFPDVINNELQGYVPENVTVANGLCTIKVEQRNVVNTDRTGRMGGAQKFASGAFTSFDKFTQTYGYFEARLKMPHARAAGIWPAFWVLPDRGREYGEVRAKYMTKEYGRGMEIDIFEFMPWWKQLDGTFPIHSGCIWSYGPVTEKDPAPHGYGSYALTNDGWGPGELTFPHLDDEFHTYGMYWSPERLIFYVDSKPIFRVKDPKHMADVPHYFLFNIAMSGNGWGKSPDKKHPTMEQIIADLPNSMQIDYFRAYSGTLEEPTLTAPTDIPGPVTKYSPPKPGAPASAPAQPTAPAPPTGDVPPAPANVGITTPATG